MRDGEAGTAVLAKRRLREFGPSSLAFIPYGESSLFVLVSHDVALFGRADCSGIEAVSKSNRLIGRGWMRL